MLVCEDPATKPDCTARAFSKVHLNWPVFVAPEEKVFPVPRFGLRGQAFSCWNAGRKRKRKWTRVKNKRKACFERTVGWKKQHDLFWTDLDVLNWRSLVTQVGHNKSPTNGLGSICRGIRLCKFRFARCQPGEHPPISICFGLGFRYTHKEPRCCFSYFFFVFHRRRYLGIARPAETRSVRQTGLKLSKYLHIC